MSSTLKASKTTAADFIKLTSKVGRDSFKRALTAIKKGGSGGHSAGPLFGRKLEDVTPEELMESVPLPVYRCVEFLSRTEGFLEEGVFRISGVLSEVKKLKELYDRGEDPNLHKMYSEPHTACSLIKLYFRELPEPLLTFDLYEAFLACNRFVVNEPRIDAIRQTLAHVPPANYTLLAYICKFLKLVSTHADVNKMKSSNLATVFAPNLLRSLDDQNLLSDAGQSQQVMQALIEDYETIFSEASTSARYDFEFLANGEAPPPSIDMEEWGAEDNEGSGTSSVESQSPDLAHKGPPPPVPRKDSYEPDFTTAANLASVAAAAAAVAAASSASSAPPVPARKKSYERSSMPAPQQRSHLLTAQEASRNASAMIQSLPKFLPALPAESPVVSSSEEPSPALPATPSSAAAAAESSAGAYEEPIARKPRQSRQTRTLPNTPVATGIRPMSIVMYNQPARPRPQKEEISSFVQQLNRLSLAVEEELKEKGTTNGKPATRRQIVEFNPADIDDGLTGQLSPPIDGAKKELSLDEAYVATVRDNVFEAVHVSSKLTTKQLVDIADALKTNTVLKSFTLQSNAINFNVANAIAVAIKNNKTMTKLDLSYNSIGSDSAKAIADALKTNTTLVDLSLHYNSIGDEGAKAFAEALKNNSSLVRLNLLHNEIALAGAKALAETQVAQVQSMRTKQKLVLKDVSVDASDEALPIAGSLADIPYVVLKRGFSALQEYLAGLPAGSSVVPDAYQVMERMLDAMARDKVFKEVAAVVTFAEVCEMFKYDKETVNGGLLRLHAKGRITYEPKKTDAIQLSTAAASSA